MATAADRDTMRSLAERLLTKTAGAHAGPDRTEPRSMPTPHLEMPGSNIRAPPYTAQRVSQTPVTSVNVPTPQPESTNSISNGGDVEMQDAYNGPTLRGDAAQLKLAREIQDSSTGARSTGRPKRQRVLTRESSISSGPGSPRRAIASTFTSTAFPPVRPTQRSTPYAYTRGEGTDDASLSAVRTPPVPVAAPSEQAPSRVVRSPPFTAAMSTTEAQGWNMFAARPTTTTSSMKTEDGKPSVGSKTEMTHSHPPAPASVFKKAETETKAGWQMKDVTNILEQAAKIKTPPHLRGKAAAVSSTTVATAEPEVTAPAATKPIIPANVPIVTNGYHGTKAEDKTSNVTQIKQEPVKVATAPPKPWSGSMATPQSNVSGDKTLQLLQTMMDELKTVKTRVSSLEEENFTMQKQLDGMLQAEERRRFLGTTGAKVPFGLDIKLPNGGVLSVQVNTELKVTELIRRIRTKVELTPASTLNPRILVDGTEAGHPMMLGELSIRRDTTMTVEFMYDGTK